jgi:hypothetical protein
VPPEEMQRLLAKEMQLRMPPERRRTTHMNE